MILIQPKPVFHTRENQPYSEYRLNLFFDKIDFPEEENECWVWKGSKDGRGYGKFYTGKRSKLAHRVAYKVFVGDIPKERYILHSCDNRDCVNPYHLSHGTQADNMRDMSLKGRQSSRLNEKQVREIKQHLKEEEFTQSYIGELYGVSYSTISDIKYNRYWSHVR